MDILHAILLGIIEGLTEFLPVSSTGHLTIVEELLGYDINSPAMTAFTAFIQIGATLATVLYFRRDIWRVARAWVVGLRGGDKANVDYKMGWAVIIGSLPIAAVGLLFKDSIETTLRSLWVVAIGLIVWSVVMYAAERFGSQRKKESETTWKDTLFIGLAQCLALIPGVSRSGATISASLYKGFDKVAATRLSFFLSIPALSAAGVLQATTKADDISLHVGWGATLVATIISFLVGYAAVAWLIKFIATHSFKPFIIYRVILGCSLLVLLSLDVI